MNYKYIALKFEWLHTYACVRARIRVHLNLVGYSLDKSYENGKTLEENTP